MGGSQKTESSVPEFVTDGGQFGVDRAKQMSQMGYMPYFGPDVAALTPMQRASMENTQGMAQAFGMAGVGGGQSPIPAQNDPAQFSGYDQSNPAEAAIYDAYQSRLGRAPDQGGFDFWKENYNPETFQQDFAGGVKDNRIDPLTGLPDAVTQNGIRGYSSAPAYMQAQEQLRTMMPGLFQAYESMFINPQTGAPPSGQQTPQQPQQQQPNIWSGMSQSELEKQWGP